MAHFRVCPHSFIASELSIKDTCSFLVALSAWVPRDPSILNFETFFVQKVYLFILYSKSTGSIYRVIKSTGSIEPNEPDLTMPLMSTACHYIYRVKSLVFLQGPNFWKCFAAIFTFEGFLS